MESESMVLETPMTDGQGSVEVGELGSSFLETKKRQKKDLTMEDSEEPSLNIGTDQVMEQSIDIVDDEGKKEELESIV
ncbi:hypothetical protein L1987_00918 [Smallanthus sonchifolius]|uniref:Uncharacterized protein n=1 Tax=Smallanthus sonchifolius TaxID=185202 RepID=A0ACB9K3L2_9ASTR|nr:hypothetical protein L1987_00918 [Smallanthus sonchifolius]